MDDIFRAMQADNVIHKKVLSQKPIMSYNEEKNIECHVTDTVWGEAP